MLTKTGYGCYLNRQTDVPYMDHNESQHKILIALIAIHKERIALYEELVRHVPGNPIELRSALEDLIAQARMFKQALIEALTGYGELSDIGNESDRPAFYETWCRQVAAIRDRPSTVQLMHIEQAMQLAYEMAQADLQDETIGDMLQSQRDELDYNITKLHLLIRKTADNAE